jgi:hypothetical protein
MEKDVKDIVYILGNGSRWRNNELRFSLRSLKNITHANVFIIGECPEWVRNVTHIPAKDPYPHKQKNAIHKLTIATQTPDISDNFILMNDDFFILEPTDIEYWYKRTLQDTLEEYNYGRRPYFEAIENTCHAYPNGLDYSLHVPFIYNKEKLAQTLDTLDEKPYLLRTIYGNQWEVGGTQMNDCKIKNPTELRQHRGQFLSTTDTLVLYPRFREYIERKFPKPSNYELTIRI